METFDVYTLSNGKLIYLGDISTEALSKKGKNYYANMARQGYYSILSVKIKKYKLVTKEVDSGYTEGEYPTYGKYCKYYGFDDRTPLK
ncbi:MAG: hypothetical protein IJ723_02370 [Ruminococcus sp.]|nr:hypothetical protein [Ruminococcus sp.]